MARFTILLWLTIGLLAACSMAGIGEPSGHVQGVVVDNENNPILGVQVHADPQDSTWGGFTGSASNVNGHYLIQGLRPGRWVLRPHSLGYIDTVLIVDIVLDSTVTANIQLSGDTSRDGGDSAPSIQIPRIPYPRDTVIGRMPREFR